MDILGTSSSDVLNIGDGADDATELAALLNHPTNTTTGSPGSPIRVNAGEGSAAGASAPTVLSGSDPAGRPSAKQSLEQISKPVVDSNGRVDCTGSVSCAFDPATKITTVTYPDGVVAMVQKVNDLTVVAYKTAAENLRTQVEAFLFPAASTEAPTPLAAAAAPAPVPTTAPVLPPPAAETAATAVNPGPPAPQPVLVDPTDARPGPRVNVTRPPMDFTPGRDTDPRLPSGGNGSTPKLPNLDTVRDAFDSVADAVGDAVDKVGKAIGAGAAEKPDSGSPATDKPATDKPKSER